MRHARCTRLNRSDNEGGGLAYELRPRSPQPGLCPRRAASSLSVSVQIVAGSDDFAERGSVSRSTLRATDALDLSKRWAAGKAPAGHRPALLWLRCRRAALYRTVLTRRTSHADPCVKHSGNLPTSGALCV